MRKQDEPKLHTVYYAIRVCNKHDDRARWLCATIHGGGSPHRSVGGFYAKREWERVEWRVSAGPMATWFETLADARRRLRCKAIKQQQKYGHRIEIVQTKLIAHTEIAWTSATDAVSKLGCLSVEEKKQDGDA